jgi:anti-sigma B factor antagonist
MPTGSLMHTSDAVHSSPLNDPPEFSLAEAPLQGGGVRLAITGDLDIATLPALRERLAAITDAGSRRLLLDLRGVSFMDSTALAAIIHTKKKLGDDGRMTLVIPPDSYPRLILEVTGLAGILDVVETLDDDGGCAAIGA